jgi:molybdopterin-guanine dinucleotide biosynthesis protein A
MSLPHAVIIAGGKGERLGGVRKGDLRIGGRRLVDRVAEALGPVAAPLMIATGPGAAQLRGPAGSASVPDLDTPTGGPLAGLAAAVEALGARGVGAGLLVSVAVDTPFLPADFVAIMRDRLGGAPAAYAAWGDQFYPPNALWRIETLTSLPEQMRKGGAVHSLKALQQMLGAAPVDWAERADADPFANVNTVQDLIRLGRITSGRAPSRLIHTLGN